MVLKKPHVGGDAHIVQKQGGGAHTAQRQRALRINNLVDVVDQRQVLVQQDTGTQPRQQSAFGVRHWQTCQHDERPLFVRARVWRCALCWDQGDVQARSQLRRQCQQLGTVKLAQLCCGFCLGGDSRRWRDLQLLRLRTVLGVMPTGREQLSLGVVQVEEVKTQALLCLGQLVFHGWHVLRSQCDIQTVGTGHGLGACGDFGLYLLKISTGHRQVAAHFGDQQLVIR